MLAELSLCGSIIGLIVGAYLCGAIPFGLLAGFLKGVDIRTQGSGNVGATNAGRVLGRAFGIAVFVLDVLKGMIPVAVCGYLLRSSEAPLADVGAGSAACLLLISVAAGCVLGHMFPVYLRFKGGKGVATSLGVLLGIYPYYTLAGLIALMVWIAVALASRYISVGSVTAAVAFPIIFAVLAHLRSEVWGGPRELWPLHVFSIVIAALVVYRHRGNLRRLMEGVEPRIGTSRGGEN